MAGTRWGWIGVSGLLAVSGSLAAQTRVARASAADPAASPVTLSSQLESWFTEANRRAPGTWGVAVGDQQGRLVWGIQPTRPMIPASTVKVLTTGFARSILGSDARNSTRVVGDGRVDPGTGIWQGTWALELNGDPSLEHQGAAVTSLTDLAVQLADRGIRRLLGQLKVVSASGEAEAIFPATWSARHQGRVFAPPVGNLTVHDNLVIATVTPGRVGQPVKVASTAPAGAARLFTVTAKTVAGRRSQLRIETLPGGRYQIAGTLGARASTRSLARAATDTRVLLEAMWTHALEQAGIEWTPSDAIGSALPGTTVMAEVQSPVFDSVASEVNRRSLNLGAELLLHWAARGDPAPADRLTAHVQQITGDYTGVRIVDGSGLSDLNRVSPMTFVSYLARFPQSPAGRNFPMLLPANGSGTLRRLGNDLPQSGVVRAKTGTLGNVASLVGYLGRPDGVLVISLMYNGASVSAARQAQWTLFRQLGAEGVVIPSDSAAVDVFGGEPRGDR